MNRYRDLKTLAKLGSIWMKMEVRDWRPPSPKQRIGVVGQQQKLEAAGAGAETTY